MAVRVAINGFGRIGRNILRAIAESGRKDIKVVAINDLGPVETNAHLLRYDSVHGRFPGTVKVKGDMINCGTGWIKVTAERDPSKLPWGEGVDIVMECTGIFTDKDKASKHLDRRRQQGAGLSTGFRCRQDHRLWRQPRQADQAT
jgi:glyceraldehyde 3-phosphate dehydrogenase